MRTSRKPTREQLEAALDECWKVLRSNEVDLEAQKRIGKHIRPRKPARLYFGNPTGNGRMLILYGWVWVNRHGVYVGNRKKGFRWPAGGPLRRVIPFLPEPPPPEWLK